MADNDGGADPGSDAGGGGENGTASLRLDGEITAFRAEFESLAAEVATEGEQNDWVDRGRVLLDNAEDALRNGNIEQGWYYLHAAKRLKTYGLEATGGKEALRGEARELLVEARNGPLGWRATAVRERLANADGTIRENLTGSDLRSAHELLHEGYQRIHLKRQHLQSQFKYLQLWAVVSFVTLLVVAIVGSMLGLVPSPLFEFADGGQVGPPAGGQNGGVNIDLAGTTVGGLFGTDGGSVTGPSGFLVYVVLAGILGASLFGLRSLRKRSVSGSTPQYLTGRQVSLARIVVGAGSALVVFFFLRSKLVAVNLGTGVDRGPFLISIAFVAGYSERLVHTAVESVASKAESETGGDEAS